LIIFFLLDSLKHSPAGEAPALSREAAQGWFKNIIWVQFFYYSSFGLVYLYFSIVIVFCNKISM